MSRLTSAKRGKCVVLWFVGAVLSGMSQPLERSEEGPWRLDQIWKAKLAAQRWVLMMTIGSSCTNEKLQCRSGKGVENCRNGLMLVSGNELILREGRVWNTSTWHKKTKKGKGEKGLRYMLKEVGGNPGKGWMITTVHLGCARYSPNESKRGEKGISSVSKTRVWTDTRAFDRSYSEGLNKVEWGWRTRGSAGKALVLVYWFWLRLVGQSGLKGGVGLRGSTGRGWGSLVMRGQGGRGGLCAVFALTAVMHGVAGDDHRWGHGDGSAPHGELVGDGIVSTAAAGAWLARSGSWKEDKALHIQHSHWRWVHWYISVTQHIDFILCFCTVMFL